MSISSKKVSLVSETDFQNCGMLMVAPKRNAFAMSCLYCENIFMRLPSFLRHLQQHHMEELQFEAETEVYAVEELVNRTLSNMSTMRAESEESGVADDDGEDSAVSDNERDEAECEKQQINMKKTGETNEINKEQNDLRNLFKKPPAKLSNISILNALEDCDVSYNFVESMDVTLMDGTMDNGNVTVETNFEKGNENENENEKENNEGIDMEDIGQQTEMETLILRRLRMEWDMENDDFVDNKKLTAQDNDYIKAITIKDVERTSALKTATTSIDDKKTSNVDENDLNDTLTEDNKNKMLNNTSETNVNGLKCLLEGFEDLDDVDELLDNIEENSFVFKKPHEKTEENTKHIASKSERKRIEKDQENSKALLLNSADSEEDEDDFHLNASILRQCLADDEEEEEVSNNKESEVEEIRAPDFNDRSQNSETLKKVIAGLGLDDIDLEDCTNKDLIKKTPETAENLNAYYVTPRTSMTHKKSRYNSRSFTENNTTLETADKNGISALLLTEGVEDNGNNFLTKSVKTKPKCATNLKTSKISPEKHTQSKETYYTEDEELNKAKIPLVKSPSFDERKLESKTPKSRISVTPTNRKSVTPKIRKSITPTIRKFLSPSVKEFVPPSIKESVSPTNRKSVPPTNKKPVSPHYKSQRESPERSVQTSNAVAFKKTPSQENITTKTSEVSANISKSPKVDKPSEVENIRSLDIEKELETKNFDEGLTEDNSSTHVFEENNLNSVRNHSNQPSINKELDTEYNLETLQVTPENSTTKTLLSLLNKELNDEEDLDNFINQLESSRNETLKEKEEVGDDNRLALADMDDKYDEMLEDEMTIFRKFFGPNESLLEKEEEELSNTATNEYMESESTSTAEAKEKRSSLEQMEMDDINSQPAEKEKNKANKETHETENMNIETENSQNDFAVERKTDDKKDLEKEENMDDFEHLLNESLSKALAKALGEESSELSKDFADEEETEEISNEIESPIAKILTPEKNTKEKSLQNMDEVDYKGKYCKTNQKANKIKGKPIKMLELPALVFEQKTPEHKIRQIQQNNETESQQVLNKSMEQKSGGQNIHSYTSISTTQKETENIRGSVVNTLLKNTPKSNNKVERQDEDLNSCLTPKKENGNIQSTSSGKELHKTPTSNFKVQKLLENVVESKINSTPDKVMTNIQNSPEKIRTRKTPKSSKKLQKSPNSQGKNSDAERSPEKDKENVNNSPLKLHLQKSPKSRLKIEKLVSNKMNNSHTPQKDKENENIYPFNEQFHKTSKLRKNRTPSCQSATTTENLNHNEMNLMKKIKDLETNNKPITEKNENDTLSRCFINTQRGDRTPMKLQDLFSNQSPKTNDKTLEKNISPQSTPDNKLHKNSPSESKKNLSKTISPKPSYDLNKSPSDNQQKHSTRRAVSIPPASPAVGLKTLQTLKECSVKLERWSSHQSVHKSIKNLTCSKDTFVQMHGETKKTSLTAKEKEHLENVVKLPSGITISKVKRNQESPSIIEITPSKSIYCKQNFTEQQIVVGFQQTSIPDTNNTVINNLPTSVTVTKTNNSIGLQLRDREPSIDIMPRAANPSKPTALDYKSYAVNRSARKKMVLQRMQSVKKRIFKSVEKNALANAKLVKSPLLKKAKRTLVKIESVAILPSITSNTRQQDIPTSQTIIEKQISPEDKHKLIETGLSLLKNSDTINNSDKQNKSPEIASNETGLVNQLKTTSINKNETNKPPEIISQGTRENKTPQTSPNQETIKESILKSPPNRDKIAMKAAKTPTTGRTSRKAIKRAASQDLDQVPSKRIIKSPTPAIKVDTTAAAVKTTRNVVEGDLKSNCNEPMPIDDAMPNKTPRKYQMKTEEETNKDKQIYNQEGTTDILDDLMGQVISEECPETKKNTKKADKALPKGIVKDYDETIDEELLNKFALTIINIDDIENFHTIEEIEKLRATAKKFANCCQGFSRIFSCTKISEQASTLNALHDSLNTTFNEKLYISDVKRLINLINFWHSNCYKTKLIDKKPLSESINVYLQMFNFIPKTAKRTIYCEFCDESFKAEHKYFTHRIQHTGDIYPYTCKLCSNGFQRAFALKTHYATCIKQTKQQDVKTEQTVSGSKMDVKTALRPKMELKTLVQSKSNSQEPASATRLKTVYKCSKCAVGFNTESEVKLHVNDCNSFPRNFLKSTPRPKTRVGTLSGSSWK